MKTRQIFLALAMTLAAIACQPNIHPEEKPEAVTTVSSEKTKKTFTFTAQNRWSIVNSNDWMYVTPSAGLPGETTVTVSFEENATMKDRSGAFYVIDGDNTLAFRFMQSSLDIINTDNEVYYVPEAGEFIVRVQSNTAYTISSDTKWIVLPDTTSMEGQGSEDEITFGLEANTGSSSRKGSITFTTADNRTLTVSVIQAAHVEVDWSREFYRGILGYRFTGDWCGFCPNLAFDVSRFNAEEPGRLNCICFYDASSIAKLRFSGSSRYEKRFAVTGKPTLTLDERGLVFNVATPVYYNVIKSFCEEEKSSFKAMTGISAQVTYSGGKVQVHPTVFVKEKGSYHIHVALLENGVVAEQTDYTNLYSQAELRNFVHNNVVRAYATAEITGDEFTADAKSLNAFNFSIDLPGNVMDKNKLAVVIYVTRSSVQGPQNVEKFTYYHDHTEFVDNSIIVSVGQNASLKYEAE